MALEIERKFLLPEAPEWLGEHPARHIEQGYLAITSEVEIRLRSSDEDHLLTVKRGHGEVREEVEVPLNDDQWQALWPLTERLRVAKTRYLVPVDGLTGEVDVFEAQLGGLVLGEIEFDSEEQSESFEIPDWLGDEVTGDDRFANQSLAEANHPPDRAKSDRRAA